ncbi:archaellin [Methanocalculus sp. AMF5]|uniref:hypothetical protein n=1 Tax=Methanocalculus sp. AMF5 TaxID=1198257 RepID=UPI00209CF644|nr:hypothetical protein [Methanocalculus sp. AMF5]MCP1661786.1 archaellin [Methanocalculus sp. AMF5]
MKRIAITGILGVFLVVMIACSGCVEINSSQQSASTLVGGMEIIERTYLWGDEGFLTKKYDVRIWALGQDIINLKGISNSQMQSTINQYDASQAQTPPVSIEKSQEIVIGAISSGNANTKIEVSGPVIIATSASNTVSKITFTVVLAAGAKPTDTSKFTYTASGNDKYHEFSDASVLKSWYSGGKAVTGKTLLERGDILEITIDGFTGYTDIVTTNKPFTITVSPSDGGILSIVRQAPASMAANRLYEVY